MSGKNGSDSSGKVVGVIVGLAAAFAARKAITAGWKTMTGKEPPGDPKDPSVTLGTALTWAAVMGVVPEMARVLAHRAVASKFRRRSGED